MVLSNFLEVAVGPNDYMKEFPIRKMGWTMSLHLKCRVLDEYRELIEKDLFQLDGDTCNGHGCEGCGGCSGFVEEELPKQFRDIIDIWRKLEIGSSHMYSCITSDNLCEISIKKAVREHSRGMMLEDDFSAFLHDIIVPITTEIWDCEFLDDMIGDKSIVYTDGELRGRAFSLRDVVKSVEHVVRSEDGMQIYETRVVYKRGLDARMFEEELARAYGVGEEYSRDI